MQYSFLNIIYLLHYVGCYKIFYEDKRDHKNYLLKGILLEGAGNLYFANSTSASPKVSIW